MMESVFLWVAAIVSAPLLSGLILKVKAFFGGKKGPPLLMNYYTLIKLMKKNSVVSRSTSLIFRLGPIISFGTAVAALLFIPFGGHDAVIAFDGDIIFVLYLLGLGRFFTIAAAMDTASPFEGMGAAREAYFPIFCEATLFLAMIFFCRLTGEIRISAFFAHQAPLYMWHAAGAPLLFVVIAFFMVLLTENARVPVDDPATHLELTMIHEVMVLDHSGPDLALIEWGASCKLFFYASLIARLILPFHGAFPGDALMGFTLGLTGVYTLIGIIESTVARYRMDKVPQFALTSFALVFFAAIISLEFIK